MSTSFQPPAFLATLHGELSRMDVEVKGMAASKQEHEKQVEAKKQQLQRDELALQQEKQRFEREKSLMAGELRTNNEDVIELNVGGKSYTTSRATLCAQPDTVLAEIFGGSRDWRSILPLDRNGAAFLDLDPCLFEILLNHLRTLTHLPPASPSATPRPPLRLPAPPPEKRAVWTAMLTKLGFIKPPKPGEIPPPSSELFAFSKDLTHRNCTLTREGAKCMLTRGISNWGLAVGGVVGGGERHVWKFKMEKDGAADEMKLRFGFIDNSAQNVKRLRDTSNHDNMCNAGRFFTFVNQSINGDSIGRKIDTGDTFELEIDTRAHPPVMRLLEGDGGLVGGEPREMSLPAEWEGYRLCMGVWYYVQGAEILSVDGVAPDDPAVTLGAFSTTGSDAAAAAPSEWLRPDEPGYAGSEVHNGRYHPGVRERVGGCQGRCCSCQKPCGGGDGCAEQDTTCSGECRWTCCGETGRMTSWPGCRAV